MKLLQAIDNYFFMTNEGTSGDRVWFFGGLATFIAITTITILGTL